MYAITIATDRYGCILYVQYVIWQSFGDFSFSFFSLSLLLSLFLLLFSVDFIAAISVFMSVQVQNLECTPTSKSFKPREITTKKKFKIFLLTQNRSRTLYNHLYTQMSRLSLYIIGQVSRRLNRAQYSRPIRYLYEASMELARPATPSKQCS